MKKVLSALLLFSLFCQPSFAGSYAGKTGYQGTNRFATSGDVVFQTSLYANGRFGASSTLASSSTGLLPAGLPYTVLIKMVGSAGGLDTTPGSTLPNGTNGQTLILQIGGLMTGGTWLVTPLRAANFTNLTFTARGQMASLVYDTTIGWICYDTNALILNQNT